MTGARGRGGIAAAAAAALVAAPAAVRAQALRVTAVDSAMGTFVPNALLTAADARGAVVASAATAAGASRPGGARLLALPGAGTYTLSVRRIGKRPYVAPPVAVGARDTVVVVLRVSSHPVALATVHVTGRARACRRGGRDADVDALWDQIRTAITFVALRHEDSSESLAPGAPHSEIRRYAIELDADARTVLAHTVLPPQPGLPRPFGTFAPAMLSAEGYVRHEGRYSVFATPDEDALLSDAFAAEHCFDAVAGTNGDAGLVGLAFRPAPSRRVPDIAGVLWADSATAALRYLTFWYVDPSLADAVAGAGRAGGEVHFATLPDSSWAMVAWRLRVPHRTVPTLADLVPTLGSITTRRAAIGWRFAEVGAVATTATPASPNARAAAPVSDDDPAFARLAARVRDGRAAVRVTDATGHPLAGASVRLSQRPDSAAAGFILDAAQTRLQRARLVGADTVVTTDATGAVEVAALPPGQYRVSVSHAAIERAGVAPPTAELVVVADSLAARARATVAPPTLASLAARCGAGQLVDTVESRIVYGTVVDASSTDGAGPAPVADARVTVAWILYEGGRSVRRVTTDAHGTYVVCGVPELATPAVGAEHEKRGIGAPALRVPLGAWRAAFVALELRPSAADTTASAATTLAVQGTIVDSVAAAPLPGAVVQMVDATNPTGQIYRATSDSTGAFTIAEVPPGRYVLRFDHPALDEYGVELPDRLSELQAGWRTAEITLAGPSAAQVLARACPQAGESVGLVVGRLRTTGDSMPVAGVRVRASWGDGAHGVTGAVGSDGVFRLCGVPRGVRVDVAAEPGAGWQRAARVVVTDRRGVTVADLVAGAAQGHAR